VTQSNKNNSSRTGVGATEIASEMLGVRIRSSAKAKGSNPVVGTQRSQFM